MKKLILIGCTSNLRHIINTILNKKKLNVEISGIINLNKKLAIKKSNFDNYSDLIKKFKIDNIKIVKSVNEKRIINWIKKKKPHLIIQSGWSQKFNSEILKIPQIGCIGVHPSPLPIGKGAATLNWAIIKNYKNWGVSFFLMNNKYDDGPIIAKEKFLINKNDYIKDILKKFDHITSKIIKKNLLNWASNKFVYKKNKKSKIYFTKRKPSDGEFNLNMTSNKIYNLIRALSTPYPGAFVYLNKKKIIVWSAKLLKLKNYSFNKKYYFRKNNDIAFKTKVGFICFNKIQINSGPIQPGYKILDYIK